eukprot:TRINITY_DN668_c0_g1_i2.p1 TRINITY_DN668_c0_g1~~TRINITY_DN668_c0_g1_i2.p1  ORF type:complete len:251 (+),score=116.34 TRINITY_DN668_c0_g1_i2:265-1017(+)
MATETNLIIPTLEEEIKDTLNSLEEVKQKIEIAKQQANLNQNCRLVAVSKTKSSLLIKSCFEAGQLHFGENYVQELIEKAAQLPKEIKWHFIGHLQSKKIKSICAIENLDFIETVDSVKLAIELNKRWPTSRPPLKYFIQINTSGEQSKSGISPSEVVETTRSIINSTPNLKFCGFMTIGEFIANPDPNHQPDFECLVNCKERICNELNIPFQQLELSMGMSHDFELAIKFGSTNVRVGSLIFGERKKKQ